jgi:hypothetical protein
MNKFNTAVTQNRTALALLLLMVLLVLGLIRGHMKPYLTIDQDPPITFDRQEALDLAYMLESRRGQHMRSNFTAMAMAGQLSSALGIADKVSFSSELARHWLIEEAGPAIRKKVSRRDRSIWVYRLGIVACLVALGLIVFWRRADAPNR